MQNDASHRQPTLSGSYPGGKSGAGIYQRLINLIPRHRILIVPFAGHCGVARNIRPAEHTIVIDQNPAVCQWWFDWSRSKQGRDLEIHHCDGIEWLRFRLGCTRYPAAKACDVAGRVTGSSGGVLQSGAAAPGSDAGPSDGRSSGTGSRRRRLVMAKVSQNSTSAPRDAGQQVLAAQPGGTRETQETVAEAFIFADPPYVMSERSTGRIYECELSDEDHQRFIGTVTQIDATRYQIMICGYNCELYSPLDDWESIDHRVPTRGGLQDERIWMNYSKPVKLHDYQYIGDGRRSRERIRRRQKNWREQLMQMSEQEQLAMLEVLNSTRRES